MDIARVIALLVVIVQLAVSEESGAYQCYTGYLVRTSTDTPVDFKTYDTWATAIRSHQQHPLVADVSQLEMQMLTDAENMPLTTAEPTTTTTTPKPKPTTTIKPPVTTKARTTLRRLFRVRRQAGGPLRRLHKRQPQVPWESLTQEQKQWALENSAPKLGGCGDASGGCQVLESVYNDVKLLHFACGDTSFTCSGQQACTKPVTAAVEQGRPGVELKEKACCCIGAGCNAPDLKVMKLGPTKALSCYQWTYRFNIDVSKLIGEQKWALETPKTALCAPGQGCAQTRQPSNKDRVDYECGELTSILQNPPEPASDPPTKTCSADLCNADGHDITETYTECYQWLEYSVRGKVVAPAKRLRVWPYGHDERLTYPANATVAQCPKLNRKHSSRQACKVDMTFGDYEDHVAWFHCVDDNVQHWPHRLIAACESPDNLTQSNHHMECTCTADKCNSLGGVPTPLECYAWAQYRDDGRVIAEVLAAAAEPYGRDNRVWHDTDLAEVVALVNDTKLGMWLFWHVRDQYERKRQTEKCSIYGSVCTVHSRVFDERLVVSARHAMERDITKKQRSGVTLFGCARQPMDETYFVRNATYKMCDKPKEMKAVTVRQHWMRHEERSAIEEETCSCWTDKCNGGLGLEAKATDGAYGVDRASRPPYTAGADRMTTILAFVSFAFVMTLLVSLQ